MNGFGFQAGTPVYAATGPEVLAQADQPLDSLWLFNEAAGDVLDKIGVNHLPAIGAPTYRQPFRGRFGITYGAADANRLSNALQPGLGSALYAAAFWIPAFEPVSNANVFGLSNGAVAPAAVMYVSAVVGDFSAIINDAVAPPLTLASAFTNDALTDPRMFFGVLQVDRADNEARLLIADGRGDYDLVTGSIAGFATLTLAGQSIGAGARGNVGANGTSYAMARLGVDAEGAGRPLQLARRLRWI